jgi:hypothetical protein
MIPALDARTSASSIELLMKCQQILFKSSLRETRYSLGRQNK